MNKIILRNNGSDLIGSDQLMYVDGRKNIHNTINEVIKRNSRFEKNLPNKVCDSFYFVNDRLKRISEDIYV